MDSQAVALWMLNRLPPEDVIFTNSRAGQNESPITVEFVDRYSATVHPVVIVTPLVQDFLDAVEDPTFRLERCAALGVTPQTELTFPLLAQLKGRFPSRKAQFCTEFLKLRPMTRWIRKNISEEFERYSGVRRDESEPRRQRQPREWDTWFDCWLNNPVVDWTKQMVFDFVRAHGQKVNPLYTLGFNRVGCAPCVNNSKDDVLAWVQRFPEMIDKVRAWEQQVGRTFFYPIVPGMEINWIDDVVRWAQTARGGRQADLLRVFNERPNCESKFGLCE